MNPLVAATVLLCLCAILGALAYLLKKRDGKVYRATPTLATESETAEIHQHTIVLYGSEYCGQCPAVQRMIEHELTSLEAQHPGKAALHEVNLTADPELARQHRITRTPTVIIFDPNQHETARFAGAIPATTFRQELYAQLGVTA